MGKNDLRGAPAAIGVAVLAVLFAGVILAIYPGWGVIGIFLNENIKLTEAAPAWVQAFGSLGAIGVTAFIARRDSVIRKEEKLAEHGKEMRRIAYFVNRSGLSENLFFLLDNFSKTKHLKIGNYNIKYNNIYYIIITDKSVKNTFDLIQGLEPSVVMDLQTSTLNDEFIKIFAAVEALQAQYNLFSSTIDFNRKVHGFKAYFDYVSSKSSAELRDLNEELNFAINFINDVFIELEDAHGLIKRKMTR